MQIQSHTPYRFLYINSVWSVYIYIHIYVYRFSCKTANIKRFGVGAHDRRKWMQVENRFSLVSFSFVILKYLHNEIEKCINDISNRLCVYECLHIQFGINIYIQILYFRAEKVGVNGKCVLVKLENLVKRTKN